MKAKKNLALVAAGIVIGAFLAFPTAHAAEELFTAVRSSHQFFLDSPTAQAENPLRKISRYLHWLYRIILLQVGENSA